MSLVSHIFFKVANSKDSELEACEYLDLFARKCGFANETIDEMRLAFIEAIINAKEHAPKDLPEAYKNEIHITLTHVNDDIEICVRDFGKGFDPTVVEKPDIRKKLKSSYKRGWGLMLMEKLMDGAEITSMPPSGTLIHLVKKKIVASTPNEEETVKEQKRFERLKYILGSFIDLSSFLCQSKNLQSGLRSMLRILLGTLGVSRGAIYTYEPEHKQLSCFVDIKLKANAKLPLLKLSEETLDKISKKSDCAVTDIIKSDPIFHDAFKNDQIEQIYSLKTDDIVHGFLILGGRFNNKEDEPQDYDNELLTIIARNISSAINTYNLMENLKEINSTQDKRLVELDKVREAAQIISSELEVENLPSTVDGLFRGLFGIRKFSMTIFDPTDKRFTICNNDRGLPSTIDMWSSPVTKYVVDNKTAVLVKDINTDLRFQYPRCKNYASDSFAVIPIISNEEVLGTVNLSDKGGDGTFTDRDFELCKLICSQLAIALKNANLYKQGITDALTGMYTNHYFRLRLAQEISRLRRIKSDLAIILVGIDNFNDLIEKIGKPNLKDLLIKKFGNSIKRVIRFNDLACRFEGEKFAIILPDTTNDGATIAAEKIFNNLKGIVFNCNSNNYKASISVSVLQYDVKMDAHDFLDIAERKLIQAQSEGGNKLVY